MGTIFPTVDWLRDLLTASDTDALAAALRTASAAMGFRFFALTWHSSASPPGTASIRIHNYPARWAEYYDRNALGAIDPVHRASHTTNLGFDWSDVPAMIPLSKADRTIIALGGSHGLGQGFTVPANIPGEPPGSCSFATGADIAFDRSVVPAAQLIGMAAFEAARRLSRGRGPHPLVPHLTGRERDCLIWVARGKSDWEIAQILGISEETVDRHLKNARERYQVVKRTPIVVRALFDGTLSFSEILDF